jgi:hypothetical protein
MRHTYSKVDAVADKIVEFYWQTQNLHGAQGVFSDYKSRVEGILMVKYEIFSDQDVVIVRIYDAPANSWRTLFVERDGIITRYTNGADAISDVRIYDSSNKNSLFEAELEVYLKSAETGSPPTICGLPSLVRFGEPDHYFYATFTLTEWFIIMQTELKIIGYKGDVPIYSQGWDTSTD